MKVTEAIKVFLNARKLPANADLVARWSACMETQLNVAAGNGEPVEGKRTTYSDGINEWWNIRLPKNANSDPSWDDYELRFPFELHAEGIGCTGWDWAARRSRWCAFDFDSLTTHARGIGVTDEELEKIKLAAEALPYVETRLSTGGKGIHLYCYFDDAGVPTDNHTEHAALARCVLGMMSSDTGFDFASQIDCCGGVMWLWHRKMTAENGGLSLVKPATKTLSVSGLPANWHDHIEVVTKKRSKVRVNEVAEDDLDPFEALATSRKIIPLDDGHKAQIESLMRSGFTTLWIADHHLLQTHTCALAKLMGEADLKLVGYFHTISEGKNPGSPNCFLFPLPSGAWKVYRFSPGIAEAETWTQDGNGWTTCYFNRTPDLSVAAKAHGALEDPDKIGEFVFHDAARALEAAEALGQKITLLDEMMDRETRLKSGRDGRLVVEIEKREEDAPMPGWFAKKGKWSRIFDVKTDSKKSDELGFSEHDNVLRELETPAKEFAGWVIHKGGEWVREPPANVKMLLQSRGFDKPEAEAIMGGAIGKSWRLVNLPFHEEYPGGRQWNMDAAQLRYEPAILGDEEQPSHAHWDKVLNHIGQELNAGLRESLWAQKAGMKTGAQYLLAWIACMIRYPFSPLPYLFLYGPENSGKSIFHEAIALLMTKGCVPADRALTSASDFNGELANCILAVVEEKDISKAKGALAKIKEWVTARNLSIRKMRTDSYTQPNTTHWVQCANRRENCPIFPGDTRITVIHVPDLLPDQEIPKEKLIERLTEEAQHFMYSLMNMELPEVVGRLRLPIVITDSKLRSEEDNRDAFEEFLADNCFEAPGALMPFKDLFDKFYESLTVNEKGEWTKQRAIKKLPSRFPTGNGPGNKKYVANISLEEVTSPDAKPLLYLEGKFVTQPQEPPEAQP
jgi:hypothetical protein